MSRSQKRFDHLLSEKEEKKQENIVDAEPLNVNTKERTNERSNVETKRVRKAFDLREDLHKRLKQFAVREDTLMYLIVEEAIQEYLDKYE